MKNETPETDAETAAEEAWCPPMSDAPDDLLKVRSLVPPTSKKQWSHPSVNIFFQPDKLGVLPALWLEAKLTISSTSIQDKFAKLFMTTEEPHVRSLISIDFPASEMEPESAHVASAVSVP